MANNEIFKCEPKPWKYTQMTAHIYTSTKIKKLINLNIIKGKK